MATKRKSKEDSIKPKIPREYPLSERVLDLIDTHQVRAAKINKALNRTPKDSKQEIAFKESALIQTKRFIRELKRLKTYYDNLSEIELEQLLLSHYNSEI